MSEVFGLRDRVSGRVVVEVGITHRVHDVSDHAEAGVRAASLGAIAAETGATPVLMHQVHGNDVVFIDDLRTSSAPACDGLITAQQQVALLARAADCVPVLLADPSTGWIGAVHAGRPGVQAGVVSHTVTRLRVNGADPTVAWIGPHVCGSCYEVPAGMQREVVGLVPSTLSTTAWGTPALDLGAGVESQLLAAGVTDIRRLGGCTREDESWPSYRRDADAATRFAGVIWSHQ